MYWWPGPWPAPAVVEVVPPLQVTVVAVPQPADRWERGPVDPAHPSQFTEDAVSLIRTAGLGRVPAPAK